MNTDEQRMIKHVIMLKIAGNRSIFFFETRSVMALSGSTVNADGKNPAIFTRAFLMAAFSKYNFLLS